jgi:L-rhamnose-H+ transport protein
MGIVLSLVAGSMLGTFAWPLKKIKHWQWANTWLIYSLWALVILPFLWAFLTVPNFLSIYGNVPMSVLIEVFLFGAGWGIASIGFGIGLSTLGIALGTAIVLGLNNALGAILPIVLYSPDELFTPAGIGISVGVGVMLVGIVICAVAGAKKEKALNKQAATPAGNFKKGLLLCIMSGVLGAMFNFALVAGKPLEELAVQAGASSLNAANPTWCVSLLGGFIVTAIYCGYLIRKRKLFSAFTQNGSQMAWIFTLIMALMWFGGVALYGTAVMNLGKLGASIGWPLIQSMAVAGGSAVGIITREWKGTGRQPLTIMLTGLACLMIGIVIVSKAGTL